MYDGSLYGQWEALVTFQQMIVLADKEGFIDITPPALSARTGIPTEIIEKGIKVLESDDPYSRTEGEDGKRIVLINPNRPWGWKIINYEKYRDMASLEDRRDYMRDYMKEYRKQDKFTNKQPVKDSKQPLAELAHTDVDTDTDVKKKEGIVYSEEFEIFWKSYPTKVDKKKAFISWGKIKPDLQTCLDALEMQKSNRIALKSVGQFCPEWKHPATWLNGECWKNEPIKIESETKTKEEIEAKEAGW